MAFIKNALHQVALATAGYALFAVLAVAFAVFIRGGFGIF